MERLIDLFEDNVDVALDYLAWVSRTTLELIERELGPGRELLEFFTALPARRRLPLRTAFAQERAMSATTHAEADSAPSVSGGTEVAGTWALSTMPSARIRDGRRETGSRRRPQSFLNRMLRVGTAWHESCSCDVR